MPVVEELLNPKFLTEIKLITDLRSPDPTANLDNG
jgi:hypothetical protein